jgi:hypothetical protein
MVPLIAPVTASNALRQRRYRARQRNPVHAVAQVEFERDALQQALINRSNLSAKKKAPIVTASRRRARWVEHEQRQHHP